MHFFIYITTALWDVSHGNAGCCKGEYSYSVYIYLGYVHILHFCWFFIMYITGWHTSSLGGCGKRNGKVNIYIYIHINYVHNIDFLLLWWCIHIDSFKWQPAKLSDGTYPMEWHMLPGWVLCFYIYITWLCTFTCFLHLSVFMYIDASHTSLFRGVW